MFERMFDEAGAELRLRDRAAPTTARRCPIQRSSRASSITGSAAGVYDDFPWLDPLRDFIRRAYAAKTPMLGICFGHQIMADALGGDVRKSEKGWGIGRHVYDVDAAPGVPRRPASASSPSPARTRTR